MAKTNPIKQMYVAPTDLKTYAEELCELSEKLHEELKILCINLKREGVETLIRVFAFARFGYKQVNAEMINALSGVGKKSDYNKLHRLAGKNQLVEEHEEKRVNWCLSPQALRRLKLFFGYED